MLAAEIFFLREPFNSRVLTHALLFGFGLFHGDFFLIVENGIKTLEKWKGEHRGKEEASGLLPLFAFPPVFLCTFCGLDMT